MRRLLRACLCLVCVLFLAAAEEAEQPSGYDAELASLQLVSQREERFANDTYRYIKKAAFVKNGCGPAALHNALSVAFDIRDRAESERVLLELMTLMADFNRPAQYGMNYNRSRLLCEPLDAGEYPALVRLTATVDNMSWLAKSFKAERALEMIRAAEGSVVIMGRMNLSQNWDEVISLLDTLHGMGYDDAVFSVADLSAGTPATKAPFCMGETGHYVTVTLQVGEFEENGTIYVLDSYPRAVRGEKLGTLYDKKYYFAENNYLTGFRQNYSAVHVTPVAVKCEPLDSVKEELAGLEAEAAGGAKAMAAYRRYRTRLAQRVTMFGTGTYILRVR